MPGLDTDIHLNMLRDYRRSHDFLHRVRDAIKSIISKKDIYGMAWGDPETFGPLRFIRERYLMPYVNSQDVAVEIGPGGGRWTRYLLPFRKLYVVDYYPALLDELRSTFRRSNMQFIANNGSDFPGIPEESVDFIFSFDCFVHLDTPIIKTYLLNMRRILKRGGIAVIHYSDISKVMARENPGFSDNDPARMRKMVTDTGFTIVEEDVTTPWHGGIIIFSPME